MKTLLRLGVDIDGGFTSFPALCFVVKENNVEMTQFLMSLGASPNVEIESRRVLVVALDNKNLELSEILLKAGADPSYINKEGASAQRLAGKLGNKEIIKSIHKCLESSRSS